MSCGASWRKASRVQRVACVLEVWMAANNDLRAALELINLSSGSRRLER